MATILVVDDLAANRDYLVALLQDEGHRLLQAADGRQGLDAIHAEHPDLVITDVLMPVMDGYELIKQVRLDPETRSLPIVFCTAHYGEREARELALAGGVSHVLTKPAGPGEVLTTVGRALRGESASIEPLTPPPVIAFDREHLRLVTDKLSEKAADLQTANARLCTLIDIGLELASEQDADRMLRRMCDAARELFDATYVTLGTFDLHNRTIVRMFSCGADARVSIAPGDPISGVLARSVRERRPIRGSHIGSDGTLVELPEHHPDVDAFLLAPIASPARVYGWLCLVGNHGRAFTQDDEDMVMALAGYVGRVIENGACRAAVNKRAEELEQQILERQRVESALRQERDRAQRYLDTADVILVALDLDGRITLINRKGCDLLGWTERELLGRDWVETCVPPRIRSALKQTLPRILRGELVIGENPILTRAGEERVIEWRNTVLRDDSGQTIGLFSSGTDVTDRNRALDALRAAEERMRFALEAAGVGIWDMDYVTRAVRWSETAEAQHGLAPGTFAATFDAFVERIHPDDRQTVLETIERAMASGGNFTLQYRTIWPDRSVHWLSGAGRVHLDARGQAVRGIGISLDITDRQTLEAQYQHAQKMEAIGRLAGGVAHDFNNLLTAILGYCELLIDDLGPTDRQREDITEIQKAATSAAALTRQLLAFSRKQIIQPTLVDLNALVGDMQAMLGRLIGEDVKIVLVLRPGLALIKADRGQTEQIVMNLALNARDAMPRGGTLTIETANVVLDEHYPQSHFAATPGPHVALTISDTGTGMTDEVKARLFEPFFTTKDPGKGTGLGLATVHGIVTGLGGSVNVYSELGKGTSFQVYFPRADAGEVPAEAALPDDEHAGAQSVLIVDDADGLRELARRLLERQGYTVYTAANCDEALHQFARHPSIDVLLTDVVMPGSSGPELARQLLARHPALKVIYMSGYTEEAIVHHGVLNRGIAFLHKPFTSETLGRAIRDAVERVERPL